MIRPHPPRLRMKRRKTVSVTPAIGASTVAGAIRTEPIWTDEGTTACLGRTPLSDNSPRGPAALSQNFFTVLILPSGFSLVAHPSLPVPLQACHDAGDCRRPVVAA